MVAKKVLSYVLPQTIEAGKTALGQTYEVSYENGHKVLNSANVNYSFGSLHQIMLKGIVEVLKTRQPKNILMLGLGAGSALQILQNKCHWPYSVTAVEIDPEMVALAQSHFGLSQYKHLTIQVADAAIAVQNFEPNQFDLIIDDVFWDDIIPTFCMSEQYLQAVQRILSSEGVYWRNTMANDQSDNYQQRYEQHFPKVHFLTHKQYGNKLYFCQKS
jgi:spermidine synthase